MIYAIYRKREFAFIQVGPSKLMSLTIPARVVPGGQLDEFLEELKSEWRRSQAELIADGATDKALALSEVSTENLASPAATSVVHEVRFSFKFAELLKANLLLQTQHLLKQRLLIGYLLVCVAAVVQLLFFQSSLGPGQLLWGIVSFLTSMILFMPVILAINLAVRFRNYRAEFENISVAFTPEKIVFGGAVIGIRTEVEWKRIVGVVRLGEFLVLKTSENPFAAILFRLDAVALRSLARLRHSQSRHGMMRIRWKLARVSSSRLWQ